MINSLENQAPAGGLEVAAPNRTLERLPLVYFNHGYEAGYRQAARDLLDTLQSLGDQFINDQLASLGEDARKSLYAYEEVLARELGKMLTDAQFVEGGLGI